MLHSSCIVLPTDEILIVGSSFLNFTRFSAIYNPTNNKWKTLGNANFDRQGANSVQLGSKIYILGGGDNPPTEAVEEFLPCVNIWSPINLKMKRHRRHFGVLSVPEKLFQHFNCERRRLRPKQTNDLKSYFDGKKSDFEYNGPDEVDFPHLHPFYSLINKIFA